MYFAKKSSQILSIMDFSTSVALWYEEKVVGGGKIGNKNNTRVESKWHKFTEHENSLLYPESKSGTQVFFLTISF